MFSVSGAQADTHKPKPKPTPHSSADRKTVSEYLSHRDASTVVSRARKVSYLKGQIAITRKAIAHARVDGALVLKIAAKYKGIPYRAGGSTPKGFDCSGYTKYVFHQAGIELPRIAQQQYTWTKRISLTQAKPGDLAFYMTGKYAYHAAIYAGNGMIWHSPRSGESVKKVKIRGHKMAYGRIPASAITPKLAARLAHQVAQLNQLVKPAHKTTKHRHPKASASPSASSTASPVASPKKHQKKHHKSHAKPSASASPIHSKAATPTPSKKPAGKTKHKKH